MSPRDSFERHDRLIRAIARRFPGHLRDDLVQSGHEELVRAARRYRADGSASLWTYARRGVVGAMIDVVKRERMRVADGDVDLVPGAGLDPEASAMASESLGALTAEERRIVGLRLEGRTFGNVGRVAGTSQASAFRISEGALATLRQRAA